MKLLFLTLSMLLPFFISSQEIIELRLSDCDSQTNLDLLKPRINSKKILNDTLLLSIGYKDNCCIEPKAKLNLNNDTLNIKINNTSDIWCACDCCFELDVKITGIKDTNFILVMNDQVFKTSTNRFYKLPEDYNINRKTPNNQHNEKGDKIGLWVSFHDNSTIIKSEEYFLAENNQVVRVWTKFYDNNGELESVYLRCIPTEPLVYFDAHEYARIINKISTR